MADSQVFLGIVLELGGKEISLEPQTAITEVRTKGIEVALPPNQTVEIGSVGANLKSILKSLEVEDKDIDSFLTEDTPGQLTVPAVEDIPGISNIVEVLFNAQLSVEQFHVKLPPTHKTNVDGTTVERIDDNKQGDKTYTIGLSAVWPGDAGVLLGDPTDGLKLKGLFFKASNEGG